MFVSVRVKVLSDRTGASIEMPGIVTPGGLFSPLLDYFIARHHVRSVMWMRKVTRSAQLFLEYMQANPSERDSRALFQNFAQRLYTGTFDPSSRSDSSGLCWQPRSIDDARNVITDLSLFFDWYALMAPHAAHVNPLVEATPYDRIWIEAARRYRRENALLGHLWSKKDSAPGRGRRVGAKRAVMARSVEPPAFPEDRFFDLLTDGFRVGQRVDYRGILITLLLHGAGFRESEPFHLFIEDVVANPSDPKSALVRIHHPSEGLAPPARHAASGRSFRGIRAAYLMEQFGLPPRNRFTDTRHAGWKGGLCDAPHYMQAHWFEPVYGELFLDTWLKYLHQVAKVSRPHPFAFINLGRSPIGGMYKLSQFNQAHADACRRIGLEVRKDLGTTPHGHRHAYGRRLQRAGINEAYIRLFMHHSSIESQAVYTQPTSTEIEEAIRAGVLRLSAPATQMLTSAALA